MCSAPQRFIKQAPPLSAVGERRHVDCSWLCIQLDLLRSWCLWQFSRWKQSLPLKRGANRIPVEGINIHWSQACVSDDQSYFMSTFGYVYLSYSPRLHPYHYDLHLLLLAGPFWLAPLRFTNSLPHFFKLRTCVPLCIISLIYAKDC